MKLFSLFLLSIIVNISAFSQFNNSQPIGPNSTIINDGAISVLGHGDFNNDSFEDLVVQTDSTYTFYLNDGFGNFNIISTLINWTMISRKIEFADLNTDGFVDMIYCGSFGVGYHLNQGNGSFSPTFTIIDNYPTDNFEVADMNNDGLLDVVSIYGASGVGQSFLNLVYSVSQVSQTSYLIDSPLDGLLPSNTPINTSLQLYDFTGNGLLDIIYSTPDDGGVYGYINGGYNSIFNSGGSTNGGTVSLPIAYVASELSTTLLKDINSDGTMDLVQFSAGNNSTSGVPTTSSLKMAYSIDVDINGSFLASPSFISMQANEPVQANNFVQGFIEDLNIDGSLDLISATADSLIIKHQTSPLNFNPAIKYAFIGNMEYITIFDFDNDGDLDIVYCETNGVYKMENIYIGVNRLEGTVYYDANQNGIKDLNENGLALWGLSSTPNNQSHITNSNGGYYFSFLLNQTNTIAPATNLNWTLTSPNSSYTESLTLTNPIIDSLDFGFYPNNNINDINPTLIVGQQLCDNDTKISLSITNQGTTIPSGIVSLTLDDSLTYVSSSPMADSVVNNIVYWTYSNLDYFTQQSFNVIIHLPDFNSLGDTMNYEMNVFADNNAYQNTKNYSNIILCSYDPNDKNVFPKGVGTDGYIAANQPLEYTVRFQNTGNAPATNVIVTDQLDANLDWNSIEVVAYSHNVSTEVKPNGQVEFKFLNIMLVDSSVSYQASQGYVVYRINPTGGLIPGDQIENTANIYFDYNPEVVTNTVHNSIICPVPQITFANNSLDCGIASNIQWYLDGLALSGETNQTLNITQNGTYMAVFDNGNGCTTEGQLIVTDLSTMDNNLSVKATAYPNPFNDFITIKFDESLDQNSTLILTDMSGRIVAEIEASNQNQIVIEKGNLSKGIYQVFVQSNSERIAVLKISVY